MPELAYVNGSYMPLSDATVSIEDRGFLFADGVYEVLVTYNGKPFAMDRHLLRLQNSLSLLLFDVDVGPEGLGIAYAVLGGIERAGFDETHVYIQVTRGVAARKHHFPRPLPQPTVVMMFRQAQRLPESAYDQGFRAISTPDLRWKRCDVKSVALLPNILAREQAARADVDETLLFDEEGFVTEAAATSAFCVIDGQVRTTPSGTTILPSITRGLLLEVAAEVGVPLVEQRTTLAQYRQADEVFIAGTSLAVMPVVSLDGQAIGGGCRGPLARRLREAFMARVAAETL